ncbi:hypothetical protein [Calothrix rhizosoleniae]|uniref:hypothetical protein n=1 Tax=Calothrix rhizosoleniae TaxID=888997 RepID=UPI000B497FB9|nr:hypothetical protein [Calothrix rhizosoleniae]
MNTHNNIDNHYLTCPICQNNGKSQLIKSGSGLFTCPYCQERLVVSHSGHYVRDPLAWKQTIFYESLRTHNRPNNKIFSKSVLFKRSLVSLILLVAMITGMIFVTQQQVSNKETPAIPKIDKPDKPE